MKRESFLLLWNAWSKRRPWKPFTLELVNGCRVEVNHFESITLGKDLIGVQGSSGVRSYFEYDSVVRFISVTGVS